MKSMIYCRKCDKQIFFDRISQNGESWEFLIDDLDPIHPYRVGIAHFNGKGVNEDVEAVCTKCALKIAATVLDSLWVSTHETKKTVREKGAEHG